MSREVTTMLLPLFDVEPEGVVFDAGQSHHQLIVRGERHHVIILIFVEEGVGQVLQVAEGCGDFAVQVLVAGADVVVHGEAADLLHCVFFAQQVGLHGDRHVCGKL